MPNSFTAGENEMEYDEDLPSGNRGSFVCQSCGLYRDHALTCSELKRINQIAARIRMRQEFGFAVASADDPRR